MKTYTFFNRPLFSRKNISVMELDSILNKIKFDIKYSKCTNKYKQILKKKYHQLNRLKNNMLDNKIHEIPLNTIEKISGSN